MSSTLETLLKGAQFVTEVLNVYESISSVETWHEREDLALKTTALMLHSMQLLSSGTTTSDLKSRIWLGSAEQTTRAVSYITSRWRWDENNDPLFNGPIRERLVEEMITTDLSVVRSAMETWKVREQMYLDMDPEEFAKGARSDWIFWKKPLDADECRRNMKNCQTASNICTMLEIIGRLKLVTRAIEFFKGPRPARLPQELQLLIREQENHELREIVQGLGPIVAQGMPHNIANALNLAAYHRIPPELAEDPVLSLYICPLTNEPIRYIVHDPRNEDHYYERSAILRHVRANPVSPLGGWELRENMLEECPELQQVIDDRLRLLTDRVRNALEDARNDAEVEGLGQEDAAEAILEGVGNGNQEENA